MVTIKVLPRGELIAHDLGPIGGWERREHLPKPRER
jgi:hypothetical protein